MGKFGDPKSAACIQARKMSAFVWRGAKSGGGAGARGVSRVSLEGSLRIGCSCVAVPFLMFSIYCWNVRGLNDPCKRGLIKLGLFSSRKVVYCLQEKKVNSVSLSFLRSFAGPQVDKCQILKYVGASGGLATCWSSRDFL